MPISFIAVQCFECSTMQVKQQKKSSNKWICVVCNQKQSVQKVFAQSFMAKDVRKVVQNFNMSRQIADQQHPISGEEPQITGDSPKKEEQKRKRSDWTEYIDNDDQEECSAKFELGVNSAQGDGGIEPLVVTEMPKATFSKPKVRNYSCRGEKLLRPSFPNRRDGKLQQNEDLGRNSNVVNAKEKGLDLKWNSFMAQIREKRDLVGGEKPEKRDSAGKNTVSKWSSYITAEDEDEDHQTSKSIEKRKDGEDHFQQLWMNDERLEEDIHPDFL
ncbi:uncharacterized protein LOC125201638 isoform X2 [Salvia hispanica]|uniref:uncharacterized protein LOC125201638 isoform X2 n=1 Tax=Salvia hispanica TaxID=49212 RepID=UPI0020090E60|nr:uncharacterized protein LOC125201638 isoform X2 [Salvia hispanica]